MKTTDKKLTDEGIIKALECCGRESCLGCPYHGKCHQGNPMIKDALDLITSQKSEIERLQKEVNLVSILYQDLQERTDEIKAEAYKEFAERLKDKIIDTPFGINCTIDMVDNLLKEMVGE